MILLPLYGPFTATDLAKTNTSPAVANATTESIVGGRYRETSQLQIYQKNGALITIDNPTAETILMYNRKTHYLVAPIFLALNQPFMCSDKKVIPMSAPPVNQRQVEQNTVLKIRRETLLASTTRHTMLNSYSILPYTPVRKQLPSTISIEGTDGNGNNIATTKNALFRFLPNFVNTPEDNDGNKNDDDVDKDEDEKYNIQEKSMHDSIDFLSSLSLTLDQAQNFDDGIVECIQSIIAADDIVSLAQVSTYLLFSIIFL